MFVCHGCRGRGLPYPQVVPPAKINGEIIRPMQPKDQSLPNCTICRGCNVELEEIFTKVVGGWEAGWEGGWEGGRGVPLGQWLRGGAGVPWGRGGRARLL